MLVANRGPQLREPKAAGATVFARGQRLASGDSRARREREICATLRWRRERESGAVASLARRARGWLARRLARLNAPVVYSWSPSARGSEPAHQLHRAAAELLGRRTHGVLAHAWLWTKAITWPLLATAVALAMVLRSGRKVREGYALSLREQWRDLLDAIWNHGIFPTEFYHRRVFCEPARRDKSLYLSERELICLLAAVNRGADAGRLDESPRFREECRARGLPMPRTCARFSFGAADSSAAPNRAALPEKDLFIRPEQWRAGEQGQCWRWNAKVRAWSCRGEMLDAPALVRRCRALAASRAYVVEEHLHNHAEIDRFSAGGVCTVHIVTGIDSLGRVAPLLAVAKLPSGGADQVGAEAGDLVAPLELASGRMGVAIGSFVSDGEFESHPASGALIAGALLPHWSAVQQLAVRAHLEFDDTPFLDWEIALTAAGPMLLGANTNWSAFAWLLPVATPFAELCLAWLHARHRADLGVHPLAPRRRGAAAVETRVDAAGDRIVTAKAPRAG